MKKSLKYILLYIIFLVLVVASNFIIDDVANNSIKHHQDVLIKQAQTYFEDLVNTRKWNASYGGVYVKPLGNQKPNPYLKNNTLKVDDNLTLIKINPAWMTRQLSEQLSSEKFHFRITSINPLNPNNIATPFEKRALEYFDKNQKREYYEFDNTFNKFNYMGALITQKPCLVCHAIQGYKEGDIRGGISVSLDSEEYNNTVLKKYVDGVYWLDYLIKEQHNTKLKVLIKKDEIDKYFKVSLKIIDTDMKKLYLVIFNDITDSFTRIKTLQQKASTDALTKLFNRDKFNTVILDEIDMANTLGTSFCVIFVDIDFFKKVNDNYGHDIGDEVLVEVAEILKDGIRRNDFIARWSGEEFIITLQSTNIEYALEIAEKIRQKVEEHIFKNVAKQTISLGLTQYINNESIESFIKRADKALYKAKESGRNKVVVL